MTHTGIVCLELGWHMKGKFDSLNRLAEISENNKAHQAPGLDVSPPSYMDGHRDRGVVDFSDKVFDHGKKLRFKAGFRIDEGQSGREFGFVEPEEDLVKVVDDAPP